MKDSEDGGLGEGEQRSAREGERKTDMEGSEDAASRRSEGGGAEGGKEGARGSGGAGKSKGDAAEEAMKKLAVEDAVMEPRVFEDLKVGSSPLAAFGLVRFRTSMVSFCVPPHEARSRLC